MLIKNEFGPTPNPKVASELAVRFEPSLTTTKMVAETSLVARIALGEITHRGRA